MVWEGLDDNGISIEQEIRSLIARHGREVYLRSRTEQKCRCYDPITEEADVDCPTCAGYGFSYKDTKVRAFKYLVSFPTSAAYRKFIADFGVMGVDEVVFYIETKTISPSINDSIIEVITDTKGLVKPPLLIERIHSINQVVDLRENYGQLAYWALRCRKNGLGK